MKKITRSLFFVSMVTLSFVRCSMDEKVNHKDLSTSQTYEEAGIYKDLNYELDGNNLKTLEEKIVAIKDAYHIFYNFEENKATVLSSQEDFDYFKNNNTTFKKVLLDLDKNRKEEEISTEKNDNGNYWEHTNGVRIWKLYYHDDLFFMLKYPGQIPSLGGAIWHHHYFSHAARNDLSNGVINAEYRLPNNQSIVATSRKYFLNIPAVYNATDANVLFARNTTNVNKGFGFYAGLNGNGYGRTFVMTPNSHQRINLNFTPYSER